MCISGDFPSPDYKWTSRDEIYFHYARSVSPSALRTLRRSPHETDATVATFVANNRAWIAMNENIHTLDAAPHKYRAPGGPGVPAEAKKVVAADKLWDWGEGVMKTSGAWFEKSGVQASNDFLMTEFPALVSRILGEY